MTQVELDALDAAWLGVMVEYTEQDFPTSKPYQRRIPGWECRGCGWRYGTAGLPPDECRCGKRWRLGQEKCPAKEESDG